MKRTNSKLFRLAVVICTRSLLRSAACPNHDAVADIHPLTARLRRASCRPRPAHGPIAQRWRLYRTGIVILPRPSIPLPICLIDRLSMAGPR